MDARQYVNSGSGRYLRASDYSPDDVNRQLTIEAVEECTFRGNVTKLGVKFVGLGPLLVLNKGNSQTLCGAFGNDTCGWIGHRVVLRSVSVEFQGEQVASLLLETVTNEPPHESAPPAPTIAQTDEATRVEPSDQVPF